MRRAGIACAILCLAASSVAAQTPRLLAPTSEVVTALAGVWEISIAGGERKCRVQASSRETKQQRMLFGAPTACKASIPALLAAAEWGVGEDGAIHIFKSGGGALHLFRRDAAGAFKAEGGDLALEPIGGRPGEAKRTDTVSATLNALSGHTPARDADRAALVGVYELGRPGNNSGCAIDLKRLPGPRARTGGAIWVATLDAGCGDEGLRIFNPTGWQYEAGRVFLVAAKGQRIGFTGGGASNWIKDPAAGRPLWMKRK